MICVSDLNGKFYFVRHKATGFLPTPGFAAKNTPHLYNTFGKADGARKRDHKHRADEYEVVTCFLLIDKGETNA